MISEHLVTRERTLSTRSTEEVLSTGVGFAIIDKLIISEHYLLIMTWDTNMCLASELITLWPIEYLSNPLNFTLFLLGFGNSLSPPNHISSKTALSENFLQTVSSVIGRHAPLKTYPVQKKKSSSHQNVLNMKYLKRIGYAKKCWTLR